MNYLLSSFLLIQIYIVLVSPLPSSTTKDKEGKSNLCSMNYYYYHFFCNALAYQ